MEKFQNDYVEIEAQLSAPHGENGIIVAEEMNRTNIEMTRSGYRSLKIQDDDNVLEIGHGNCFHLKEVLALAKNIHYSGVEISETMNFEAIKLNTAFYKQNIAKFKLYDGVKLPFEDSTFNCAYTVNCIYFWEDTKGLLDEIYRVLKPEGKLAIVYAEKEFMKTLPFVNDRFKLYDEEDIQRVISGTSFKINSITGIEDRVKTKLGDFMNRKYSVALVQK